MPPTLVGVTGTPWVSMWQLVKKTWASWMRPNRLMKSIEVFVKCRPQPDAEAQKPVPQLAIRELVKLILSPELELAVPVA